MSASAARALLGAGQFGAAQRLCEAALARQDDAELRFLLGTAFYRQGLREAATVAFDRALALDAGRHDVRFARGSVLAEMGRKAAAATDLEACLAAAPRSSELAVALAIVREDLGELDAAMALYDRAIELDPASIPARLNRGTLLLRKRRYEDALREFDALASRSPLPAAHVNRAQALFALFRDEEALAAADAALAIEPRHPLAAYNRAYALAALGRVLEAEQAFRQAREIDPAQFRAISLEDAYGGWKECEPDARTIAMLRAVQLQQLCDWRRRDEAVARIRELPDSPPVLARRHMEVAFDVLGMPLGPDGQLAVQRHIARAFPANPLALPARASAGPRIRVGFLSPDFRSHPMAWLSKQVLRGLDRERFQVLGYALNPDSPDPERLALLRAADRFIDASRWTDEEVARRIAADGVDVLVECGGYCEGTRPGILALRGAPVQASWLGLPGTLGFPSVDYRLSDAWCTPESEQEHWVEKLVLLPETQLVYDPPAEPAAPPTREALGLPTDAFVYTCLSNPLKIEPTIFAAWMEILAAVPSSVLWIFAVNPLAQANLRREIEGAGIDPARLLFASSQPHAEFGAAAACADLFLDTRWFGAHTTAMDVLWGGLPLLTCTGEAMAARLAGSLLHAARLPELVVSSLESYVATAIRLARSPAELAELRRRLREARTAAPIFDAPARIRAFGNALVAMHERRVAGLPPATLVAGRDFPA
jgi:protein O-GlcNAc transferase